MDTLEAGWDFVDKEKLIIYGAIDPLPNILEKMDSLAGMLVSADKYDFRNPRQQAQLIDKVKNIKKLAASGRINAAQFRLEKELLPKTNGCQTSGSPDSNDWVVDCELQKMISWIVNEQLVLFSILNL